MTVICETPAATEQDLAAGILAACGSIQNTPGVFERVRQNVVRHYNACNEVGCRHFEHSL